MKFSFRARKALDSIGCVLRHYIVETVCSHNIYCQNKLDAMKVLRIAKHKSRQNYTVFRP